MRNCRKPIWSVIAHRRTQPESGRLVKGEELSIMSAELMAVGDNSYGCAQIIAHVDLEYRKVCGHCKPKQASGVNVALRATEQLLIGRVEVAISEMHLTRMATMYKSGIFDLYQ